MAVIATFTVSLSAAPGMGNTITVGYATVDGPGADGAKAATHYTAASGTLSFTGSETSKTIAVTVQQPPESDPERWFSVVLSNPTGATILDGTGNAIIPGITAVVYETMFATSYELFMDPATGFFGPDTALPANRDIPYHAIQNLCVEAPDWGHQTVSETISFWARVEAFQIAIGGSKTGYERMWNSVENNYIPSATNQPLGTYDPASPGTYQAEGDLPSAYPTAPNPAILSGTDPLYTELVARYGNNRMYLMHWMFDVDGKYGFHNGDGSTKNVAINTFSRGMQESSWETITCPQWEDWNQQAAGGNVRGYLPIYGRGTDTTNAFNNYGDAGLYDYSKQWRYTCAPDAEVRLITASYLASKFAAERGLPPTTAQDAKAKKMGDYLRYALYDKYYRPIGGEAGEISDASGCHGLVSWYVAWGGEIPAPGEEGVWGFRIGSSESHIGYNGVDVAWIMAPEGGGWGPTTLAGGATRSPAQHWAESLDRQLEFIRFLQSPEGPIAGGVSNSWKGRYEVPNDGRQNVTFHGMYYTYSPVWHDPPSNDWYGFQAWGLERLALVMYLAAGKTGTWNASVYTRCSVILDRWVNWLLDNATVNETTFELPVNLKWVRTAEEGPNADTTTVVNNENVYEYLPNKKWNNTIAAAVTNGTTGYAKFWDASTVWNTSLHCEVRTRDLDMGSAASTAQLLIQYADAKRIKNIPLSTAIPGGSHTVQDALDLAKAIIDKLWNEYQDDLGFAKPEARADYARYNDIVYAPPIYTGKMANGDTIYGTLKFNTSANAAQGATTLSFATTSFNDTTTGATRACPVKVGMQVVGTGVPPDTRVTAVTATSVTLNKATTGAVPSGTQMTFGSTFISIRTWMKTDPEWSKIEDYWAGGEPPVFTYNRFWHTCDIITGFAMMKYHFPDLSPDLATPEAV